MRALSSPITLNSGSSAACSSSCTWAPCPRSCREPCRCPSRRPPSSPVRTSASMNGPTKYCSVALSENPASCMPWTLSANSCIWTSTLMATRDSSPGSLAGRLVFSDDQRLPQSLATQNRFRVSQLLANPVSRHAGRRDRHQIGGGEVPFRKPPPERFVVAELLE